MKRVVALARGDVDCISGSKADFIVASWVTGRGGGGVEGEKQPHGPHRVVLQKL